MEDSKCLGDKLSEDIFYTIEKCIIWRIDNEIVRPNGYYSGNVGLLIDPEYPDKIEKTEWLNSSDIDFNELTEEQQRDIIENAVLMWEVNKEERKEDINTKE